jgi:NAD(P)-dependent dehydrogenase (short-subunit alcohol dehydrogenase family)
VLSNIILINNLLPKIKSLNFGKLVFISTGNASIGGNANNEMFGYKITKTTMNQVIRTMSYSNILKNIISVSLNPGWVKTKMGGLNAPLTPEDAASRIFDFIKAVNVTHNGKFLNTDLSELPW